MTQPIKGTRVLGIDPGIRTGTKCAGLDETGKYLGSFVMYQQRDVEATKLLLRGISEFKPQLIAIGNGTGSREVQELVAAAISGAGLDVLYTMVDEDGASVYSASDIAREEFPDLDLTIRGAISIGRRLQDPLAELVKIDPKSIGVGLYQHDVNQKKLATTLDGVVESCVNQVGVDLNTASPALLAYVAGINKTVAANIVSHREKEGSFKSRAALKKVAKLGPVTFQQCAGFLRIPGAENYLDRSAVHPESYSTAQKLMEITGIAPADLGKVDLHLPPPRIKELAAKLEVGEPTLKDILAEFVKPGRDPRDDLPQPVFKKGILHLEDLTEGMELEGIIRNVVDFGAFVDIGVHEDGLIHISELSNSYVRHPLDVVKVGDIVKVRVISVDLQKKRISLSLKKAGI